MHPSGISRIDHSGAEDECLGRSDDFLKAKVEVTFDRSTGCWRPERTTVATTWHGVGRSSDCPFPAPDQMPIGPVVAPSVIARHARSDARGQEPAPCRRRRQFAKASSCCGETSHSSQAAGAEQQRCRGQRRRGKVRPDHDLHEAGPARPHGCVRQFPRHPSGWPMFLFCIVVLLLQRETELARISPQARSRNASRRRRIPVPASPRIVRAATATKHEPGLSPSVSYGSALEVCASW